MKRKKEGRVLKDILGGHTMKKKKKKKKKINKKKKKKKEKKNKKKKVYFEVVDLRIVSAFVLPLLIFSCQISSLIRDKINYPMKSLVIERPGPTLRDKILRF